MPLSSSACSPARSALAEMRKLHATLLIGSHGVSTMLTAQLVRVYARQGGVEHVLRVFNGMPGRNSFVWNTVIKGLVDAGQF
jgi:hypothetical protein